MITVLRTNNKPQRMQDSSFISKWTFSFFNNLLRKGKKNELNSNDFAPIEDDDKSKVLAKSIENCWKKQLETGNPSLWKVIFQVFGYRYSFSGIIFLIEAAALMSQGWFLAQLLTWIADPKGNDGYWYAAGIAFDNILYVLIHHVSWFITVRTGMQVRVGLVSVIYQKLLSLSAANTSSTGFITNLVSNDVQRFEDLAPFLHYVWLAPLQIIGFGFLIYEQIGLGLIPAIGSLSLLSLTQASFSPLFKKFRAKTVYFRDERIKSVSDMIAGIMIVKLYAWEIPFIKKIIQLRDDEINQVRKASNLKAVNFSIFFSTSTIINLFTFTIYYLAGGILTPSKVFSTIVYLNVLKFTMTGFLPLAAQFISEAHVSVQRIEAFLKLEEIQLGSAEEIQEQLFKQANDSTTLIIQNGSFAWDKDGDTVLRNINMSIPSGLYIVAGTVGSGKSSLLQAILNDMFIVQGAVGLRSKNIAYVSQTPWILSGTIKENILFGKEFDAQQYAKVIECCALNRDLQLFADGSDTLIGERGVTLSGGQRARVALARAIYKDADIYLLDDPLSAVDPHVSRHIFEKCLRGVLKDKTILLVTHQIQFMDRCDEILVMVNGEISQKGDYETIINSNSEFAKTVQQFKLKAQEKDKTENEENTLDTQEEGEGKELKEEGVAVGAVTKGTYLKYFKNGMSPFHATVLFLIFIATQAALIMTDVQLALWSRAEPADQGNNYLIPFLILAISTIALSSTRCLMFINFCLRASNSLFKKMVNSVFGSPMAFFQSNPHGRIMNRFSKDLTLCDEMLPQVLLDVCQFVVQILGIFAVICIIVPWLLLSVPILVYLFVKLRNYYMATSRQVKRIEAVTRSPIYSAIPYTIEGLSTIRGFGAKQRFLENFFNHVDENTRIFFGFIITGRWLGIRLDAMVATLVTLILFISVSLQQALSLSPTSVGLLVSYSLQMLGGLQWSVRQSSEAENYMVSTERLVEYSELPGEAPAETAVKPPKGWPTKGKVEFKDMSLIYPNLEDSSIVNEPVLKSINVVFEAGTKVGVVGRTGAGKSSLLQALFRIVEPLQPNSIIIDDISTSEMGLRDLRSSISIIPQEPFCFKGTLRFNLDPFNEYSDDYIWKALRQVEFVDRLKKEGRMGLDASVAENGSDWSVGERQLICLARAVLRNTKLIVMDEATSNVDMMTDHLIQKAIRSESGAFANSTIITIAHRLNTIIDYDKILVLEAGQVVEFGSPTELMAKNPQESGSYFARMLSS